MIELTIKITGKTLLNNKVDDFMKVIRQIQETEENLDTKIQIKNKKEKVNKKPIKQEEIEEDEDIEEEPTIEDDDIEDDDIEDDVVDEEEDEDDNDEEDIDDLRKEAKSFFIKLTKKDKSKAEKFLKKYDVDSLSGLDKVFKDDTEKWEKAIKLLKKYVG